MGDQTPSFKLSRTVLKNNSTIHQGTVDMATGNGNNDSSNDEEITELNGLTKEQDNPEINSTGSVEMEDVNQEIDGIGSVDPAEIHAADNTKTTKSPLNPLPPILDDIVPLPPIHPTTAPAPAPAPANVPGAQSIYDGFSGNPNSFGINHGEHTASNLQESFTEAAILEIDNQETHLLESDGAGTEPRILPKHRSKKHWRQRLLRVLSLEINVFLLAVMAILLIILAVSNGGHTSSNSSQPNVIEMPPRNPSTPQLATMPTMAPTTFLESLPEYSLSAMERAQSPQSKAYQWLISNQNSSQELPRWRLTQRFALATFYFSTRGDHWVSHRGWLDWATNECNWEQVYVLPNSTPEMTCNEKGEITVVTIERTNNLEGTIPPEISLLGNSLESFMLYRQLTLTGSIPTEVGLLTKLTRLLLSVTSIIGTLPTELGLLQDLEEITILESHRISGSLPSELGKLVRLSALHVARTNLAGLVPVEIFQLHGLRYLTIEECPGLITECALEQVVCNMQQLVSFSLSSRSFGAAISIPSEIGNLTELQLLRLHDWRIHGALPSELGKLTKLVALDVSGNSIFGTLPHELFALTYLYSLLVGSNQLEGTLPLDLFTNLARLEYLNMNGNHFSGTVPTEVGLLSSLVKLELQNTSLSGTIPTELVALENMTSLAIKNTSLSGSIPEELCEKLYQKQWQCHQVAPCQLLPVKTNTSECHGTGLCGCDCGPCP
ncbi:leucine rich repeat [Seminavis robusta]|uniref:Leucine rich repeat n=2 Tax=Seminavis robusta TaxID=568900 RepID=A0A9N8EX07_9STRA|nr:leucine rich repeat [Seminavis robusta]|eukprot:Sro2324_g323350.1 leucine rich repeat (722) ;mRNA; f:6587-9110